MEIRLVPMPVFPVFTCFLAIWGTQITFFRLKYIYIRFYLLSVFVVFEPFLLHLHFVRHLV